MKRSFRVYRLNFRSPLHIGVEGTSREDVSTIAHSDTILGAIFSLAVKVDPQLCRELLNSSAKVSSAFPFFRGVSSVDYFMPIPILPPEKMFSMPEDDHSLTKKLKKLNLIPLEWFEKILNGNRIAVEADALDGVKEKLKDVFKTRPVPKVALDRVTQDSNLFHYGELHFDKGGLFFWAEFKDIEVRRRFEAVLKLLGDEGLGGRRTAGYGLFDVEPDTIELEIPESADRYLLLSLYWPPKNERDILSLKNSSYRMVRRAGWFLLDDGRSYRRRPIWMLREGSVLNIRPIGGVADVTPNAVPDKHVYRFGYALSLPIKAVDHANL
ncbi:type III-A CRISPR-associated RAMP protein Csm4 [Hydrogenimonas sp.]